MNNSEKMFQSVLREKHEQFKSGLLSLLDAISNNDQANKLAASKHLKKVGDELASILAQSDRPDWLVRIIEATRVFSKRNPEPTTITSGSSWELLKELLGLYPAVMNQKWVFEANDQMLAYNFDDVFARARSNSRLSELFDSMISSLETLLSTGGIDSLKAIEALKKLIATLSQNKNGSYFSTIASWEFVRTFTKNYIWKSLEKIPGVQTAKSAFEETLKEMNVEIEGLHKKISAELLQKFEITPSPALSHDSANPLYIENIKDSDAGNA